MACAAVLIPCHNHRAEALPVDVPVEELLDVGHLAGILLACRMCRLTAAYLQGPVLCAKLSKRRQLHWCAASSTEQVQKLLKHRQLVGAVNTWSAMCR